MQEHDPSLAELLKTRTSLAKALEENPIFQALQHIDHAIAALQTPRDQSSFKRVMGNLIQGGLTSSQRDAIAEAAAAYFIETHNMPTTVKRLCEELRRLGIPLPEADVSSVGGILGKRNTIFAKSPDRTGFWELSADYYGEHKNSGSKG